MNTELCPGDLVTPACRSLLTTSAEAIIARRPGSWAWDLWLPRSSIMTIIGIAPSSMHGMPEIVTVLRDGEMLEVFLADVQRVDWAQGPPVEASMGPPSKMW